MSIQVLFIGLEETGASIGMAFGESGVKAERLGFDPDPKVAKEAMKRGAVDRLVSRPASVAHEIDLAITSLVNREAEEYIGSIAPRMKEGSLIFDASPNKATAEDWARRAVPPRVHYLGIAPMVGPGILEREPKKRDVPSTDRYREGLLAIVARPDTHEKAIDTAVGMAEVIGASPLFIEAAEHDAIRSAAEALPTIVAIALQRMLNNAPSWREMGRMAGGDYADVTAVCERISPRNLGNMLAENREHILPRLNALMGEIQEIRKLIADEEAEQIEAFLEGAVAERKGWIGARQKGSWGRSQIGIERPPKRGLLGSLFGLGSRGGQPSD
jgi:prephenate dehydrogenase